MLEPPAYDWKAAQAAAAEWSKNPLAVPEEEHERYCVSGTIPGDPTDSYGDYTMCPVCTAQTATTTRLANIESAIQKSGIGQKYLQIEWDDLELLTPLPRLQTASTRITDILDAGQSVLLHGPPGTGKTQAAVLLAKAAIRAGRTARVANLGRLGMDIRAGYDGPGPTEASTVYDLSTADLLVLDDIGAGETGGAKVEQRILYLVTEARQNAARPSVLTTNLSPQDLAQTVGARIINRWQPLTMIEFQHGRNFRKPTSTTEALW